MKSTKFSSFASLAFLLAMNVLCPRAEAAAARLQVVVSAGATDRLETVAELVLPNPQIQASQLVDGQGRAIPVQVDPSGRARFIVRDLKKNESRTYQLIEPVASAPTEPGIQVERVGSRIEVSRAKTLYFAYQADPSDPPPSVNEVFRRGGYIHPIFSPSGKLVTDDYPPDHRHHHGIWFPWTRTTLDGVAHDFWNVADRTGNVEYAATDRIWSGPVDGGFLVRQRHVALTSGQAQTALNESWEVRAYNTGQGARPMRIFDIVSIQECATPSPVLLPQYYYGGMSFRGSVEWRGTNQEPYLTSEGISEKLKGNETRGRWCFVGGRVAGELTGVAILCHPDNFRSPQPMRLNPADPFFCFAPSQLGPWEITPGKPYVSKYRFVALDGPPDRAELDRLWEDYAHPPEVRVQ